MPRSIFFLIFLFPFSLSGCLPKYQNIYPALDIPSTQPTQFPCKSLSMSAEGLTCEIDDSSLWESTLFLPFPRLYINTDELDNIRTFPVSSVSEEMDILRMPPNEDMAFVELRDVRLRLSLEPVTPSYLMPYLSDIWSSWGGNRVPYTGKWEVSYLLFMNETWKEYQYAGKISPNDISNLPDNLAADVDYNGVPSAFWNYQVVLLP